MNKLQKFLTSLLITAFCLTAATNISNAEKVVNQKAYYDTFVFYVNGTAPVINDYALKPFIANNRTYIPIRTLSDLGICNIKWTPGQGGLPATLSVLPSGGTSNGQSIDDLKATNEALAQDNKNLQNRINELSKTNTDLEKQIEELKKKVSDSEKKNDKKDNKKGDSKYRDPKDRETDNLVRDLERTLDDRYYSRIELDREMYNVDYDVRYKRGFTIDMVIDKMNLQALVYLNNNERRLEYLLEDIGKEVSKNFADTYIDFTIYNGDLNNKIGTYNYEIDKNGESRYGIEGKLDKNMVIQK